MTTVVLYTAQIGDYDDPWEPVAQEVPADLSVSFARIFACPEVRPDLYEEGGFRGRHLDRMEGRWAKCHPHRIFPDADISIWVDACVEITSPTFVADVVAQVQGRGLALFEHPDRETIWAEVAAADEIGKYPGNRHAEMARTYDNRTGGVKTRLYAMTVMAREHSPMQTVLSEMTWTQTLAWSTESAAMDQIILPYLCDIISIKPVALIAPPDSEGTLWSNGWFTRHPHKEAL